MASLPSLKSQEILQALLKVGFYIRRQKGSHARLFHSQKSDLKLTIPIHNQDIPDRTLRRILKQANLTDDEFLKLLRK
jgi:predicted RNA binding protein YcfA (HicA-like mRNA interferase family)